MTTSGDDDRIFSTTVRADSLRDGCDYSVRTGNEVFVLVLLAHRSARQVPFGMPRSYCVHQTSVETLAPGAVIVGTRRRCR